MTATDRVVQFSREASEPSDVCEMAQRLQMKRATVANALDQIRKRQLLQVQSRVTSQPRVGKSGRQRFVYWVERSETTNDLSRVDR